MFSRGSAARVFMVDQLRGRRKEVKRKKEGDREEEEEKLGE